MLRLRILAGACLISAVGCETVFLKGLALFLRQAGAGPFWWLWHGAAGVFLAAFLVVWMKSGPVSSFAYPQYSFAAVLILLFPGPGMLAAAVFLWMARIMGRRFRTGVFDEYDEYIRQDGENDGLITAGQRLLRRMREEAGFSSLADIMSGRSVPLKIRAIEKLCKSLVPEKVKLLRRASQDESPEVRLYAATALLKLEVDAQNRIEAAGKAADFAQDAEAFTELGNLYREYALSGLAEKSLSRYYLEKAIGAYRDALDRRSGDPEAMTVYGRCLLELDRLGDAGRLADGALRLWPQREELVFLRNEIYYRLGRYDLIQEAFEVLPPEARTDPQRKEVIQFWTGKHSNPSS